MPEDFKPDIWLQQLDEPSEQFSWFSAYLACEKPRSPIQAYRNYVSDRPALCINSKEAKLPYAWHMLSLGLDEDGNPNGLGTWVSRASAYDAWLEEAEQHAERTKKMSAREVRRGFMGRMETLLTNILDVADANNPQQVRAASHAFATFLDQSRQEYNDLPVTRRDLTTGNEKLKSVTIVWEKPARDSSPSLLSEGEKVEDDADTADSSSNPT